MSQAVGRKLRDMRDTKRGHFRILTTHALMRSFMASALADVLRTRDDVQVFFDVRRMEGVIEAIESGYADLGFAIAPPPRPNVTAQPLMTGNMVVVLPNNHPLAAYDKLGPAELMGHTIIGLEQTSRLGRIVREQFAAAGSPYIPHIEVRHCTTACTLVEHGLGISIVDPFSVDAHNRWQMAVRPFSPAISVAATVLHLSERPLSRLASRFISHVRESVPARVN
jgi:DNA-binding transcriptional LysR family regulator